MRKWLSATLIVITLCAGLALGAQKKIIRPKGTKPDGNYSPGILLDGTLYISGQAGEDANGKIPTEFEAEVKQSLDNIGVVLKEAGMTPDDVCQVSRSI